MSISSFMERNFLHFNARETLASAKAWRNLLQEGGKMFLAMAGAMSTAELGISLAQMIRAGKVHAISTTAANLEEDIFNLIAHDEYKTTPDYLALSAADEVAIRDAGFNRVTDTCIPESAFRKIEALLLDYWIEAAEKNESHFQQDYIFRLIREGKLDAMMQVPREHSWVAAAMDMEIPIFAPGFEDSTMGNVFAARVIDGMVKSHHAVRTGTEQMQKLVEWYMAEEQRGGVGFFQIGGGIAGDFPICAVPLLIQDLERKDTRHWSYFAQISDSTTSYGSYSGAVPNEKITWHKLDADAPKFMINSDASIVAPLIFAYVMGE
ncbi:MAG: deoxyhypusine synthase family protein [Pirellulales bacterium]|nr:deoxyhypusine synthase family protein [Pirellulales bacterium]